MTTPTPSPVPYPTDPNRPPSNSVGPGGTPPPEDDSAFLPPVPAYLPPGPAQPGTGSGLPPNMWGPPAEVIPQIPNWIPLPQAIPGIGFIPRGGSVTEKTGGILRQSEQWPDRCAANLQDPHYDDYSQVDSEFEDQEGRDAEPPTPEPSFSFADPEGDHAYHTMPHHDPCDDQGKPWLSSDERWYRNEGGRWEPPSYVERAQERADEDITADEESGYNWGPRDEHVIADPGFREFEGGNALDHEYAEHFVNRDPELGTTAPRNVAGDPEGAVSIERHKPLKPQPSMFGAGEATVLHPEETGLEYSVIARPNPKGDGWDVLQVLE